jgi:hypothetical protein
MALQNIDPTSLTALADLAARRLAAAAITNLELREALHTTRSENGVRVGGCEISYRVVGEERVFDLHIDRGDYRVEGIAFYETARYLAYLVNAGRHFHHHEIQQVIDMNSEYVRARAAARFHSARVEHYSEIGDEFRAGLNENKLSRDIARVSILSSRLLEGYADHY